ncbi:P1 family peptidase [Streptomyces sp. M19]
MGNTGAGAGAVAAGLKGGTGSASVLLPSGTTVAALAVVNATGAVFDPRTGELYGLHGMPGPYGGAGSGAAAGAAPARGRGRTRHRRTAVGRGAGRVGATFRGVAAAPLNTTLAVVATDADLSRAQAHKLAGTAHDGLARAVRPVHLMTDGDTVFALATGDRPVGDDGAGAAAQLTALNEVLAAGADVLTRAVVKAVLAAEGVDGPGGSSRVRRSVPVPGRSVRARPGHRGRSSADRDGVEGDGVERGGRHGGGRAARCARYGREPTRRKRTRRRWTRRQRTGRWRTGR